MLNNNNSVTSSVSKEIIVLEVCIMSGIQIPLTILYGVFSHDPDHYESSKCVNLLYYSQMLFYLLCAGVLISSVISPIIGYVILTGIPSNLKCHLGLAILLNIIRTCLGLAMSTFFVLICIAFAEDEPCGNLRTLNLAYIILVGIGLGIGVLALLVSCCTICCAICLVGVSGMNGSSVPRVNESNQREYQNME